MLTEKWKSVNGVRFRDPNVLFGVPNYIDVTIKTTRVDVTTFANLKTLQQGLPKLRRDDDDPTRYYPKVSLHNEMTNLLISKPNLPTHYL